LVHALESPGDHVLLLDGHKSHITLELADLAAHNRVTIVCLPPNTTHELQPLDKSVFETAKSEWRKVVDQNGTALITKESFPKLLRELATKHEVFKRRHAVSGFESTGIYPLDRNAIDRSKLIKAVNSSEIDDSDSDGDSSNKSSSSSENDSNGSDSDGDSSNKSSSSNEDKNENSAQSSKKGKKKPNSSNNFETSSNFNVRKPLANLTNTNNNISQCQMEEIIEKSIKKSTINKQSSVKRKVVSQSGGCITSQDSINLLREEKDA
jgi:hypothetical protein